MPEKRGQQDGAHETSTRSGAPLQERLKVVVRRLPPNLPEDIFWSSVEPWVTADSVQWKTFCPGKLVNRPNKENIPSRAYIAFKAEGQIAAFSQGYDGHLFRDKAGNESYAVVEFAPYQKIPPDRKKQDARNGTIESDEDYISFLEMLKQSTEATESSNMEHLLSSIQAQQMPSTTPLLEALKAEKSAKNDKDAILRNHAHYKEHGPDTKKEEGKKKAPPTPKNEQKLSKKARKAAAAAAASTGPSSSAQPKVILAPPKTSAPATPTAVPQPSTPAPKPSRAARQRQAQAEAKAKAAAEAAAQPPSSELTAQAAETLATTPAPAPPRRSRPIIGAGGAARHFEAALSGAVGAVPKSRREDKAPGPAPDSAGLTAEGGAPSTPVSPRKSRPKRPSDTRPPPPKMVAAQTSTSAGTLESAPTVSTPPRRGRGRGKPSRGGGGGGGGGGEDRQNPGTKT